MASSTRALQEMAAYVAELETAARALADAVEATSAWYVQPVRRRCEELKVVLNDNS